MAPSKTYNLPGLSCAYAVIEDPKLRNRFRLAIRGIITEVNCFGYAGCRAAYEHGEAWRRALLAYLKDNYRFLSGFVRERLPGVDFRPMEATYLAWFDVSALGLDDPAAFFEKAGVGLSDGVPFGAEQCLRLNFGCPRSRLAAALERMERALAGP
jgi:cystathionine beta-lyase